MLRQLLDSEDPQVELHLAITAVAAILYMVLSAWTVIALEKPFDGQAFGIGLGVLLTGGGIGAVCQGVQRRVENGPSQTGIS